MDIAAIVQSIVNYGLPSVLCVVLIYLLDKQSDRHKEELKELSQTIDNNTKAINELADKLIMIEMYNNRKGGDSNAERN
jgi:hypothetical protein